MIFMLRFSQLLKNQCTMQEFKPNVLLNDKDSLVDYGINARKLSGLGDRTIYFGHGKPVPDKQWTK